MSSPGPGPVMCDPAETPGGGAAVACPVACTPPSRAITRSTISAIRASSSAIGYSFT